MKRKITLTEERFRELMKAAYLDGVDDGDSARVSCPQDAEALWAESVTYEQTEDAISRARNGRDA